MSGWITRIADRAENSILQTISIAVSAILIAAGLVTAPGLIIAARDTNAESDLASIAQAEAGTLARGGSAMIYDDSTTSVRALETVDASGLRFIPSAGVRVIVDISADGQSWAAAARANGSPNVWIRTSASGTTSFTTDNVITAGVVPLAAVHVDSPPGISKQIISAEVTALLSSPSGDYGPHFAATSDPTSTVSRRGASSVTAVPGYGAGSSSYVYDVSGATAAAAPSAAYPAITTTTLPDGNADSPYSATIAATGIPAPAIAVAGLPDGLTAANGVISGTPTADGTYNVVATATNSYGSSTATYALRIAGYAPAFTTAAALPDAPLNASYSAAIAATGKPAPAYSVASGSLPAGLALASSGAIAGTATAAGSSTFLGAATNSAGADYRSFTIAVTSAPVLTTATLPVASNAGSAYAGTLAASGSPAPTFSWSGQPAGLTLSSAGSLGGSTTAAAGDYTVIITVANRAGSSTYARTLTVAAPPAITTAALPNATTGSSYSQAIAYTGSAVTSWTLNSGALPAGLSLNTSTGVVSGTPTAAGSFSITVTATNAAGSNSRTITLNSYTAPAITTTSLPNGTTGQSYSRALAASGSAPTWSVTAGSLPAGLGLSSSGTISGTPTGSGTSSFTVRAQNAAGSDTQALSIAVYTAPAITTSSLATARVGSGYSQSIAYSGSAATGWSISGALPSGVSFGNGSFSGTPANNAGGTYSVTVTVTNQAGSDSQGYTLTVYETPELSSAASFGTTDVFQSVGAQLAYDGGYPGVSGTGVAIHSDGSGGSNGLGLSGSAYLSGTPSSTGRFTYYGYLSNAAGSTGWKAVGSQTVQEYYMDNHTGADNWANQGKLDYDPCTIGVDCSSSWSNGRSNVVKLVTAPGSSVKGQATFAMRGLIPDVSYGVSCSVGATTTSITQFGMNVSGDAYDTVANSSAKTWYGLTHTFRATGSSMTLAVYGLNTSTSSEHEWELQGCTVTAPGLPTP